eukprot:768739-Hanusia_phi.AAC.6
MGQRYSTLTQQILPYHPKMPSCRPAEDRGARCIRRGPVFSSLGVFSKRPRVLGTRSEDTTRSKEGKRRSVAYFAPLRNSRTLCTYAHHLSALPFLSICLLQDSCPDSLHRVDSFDCLSCRLQILRRAAGKKRPKKSAILRGDTNLSDRMISDASMSRVAHKITKRTKPDLLIRLIYGHTTVILIERK